MKSSEKNKKQSVSYRLRQASKAVNQSPTENQKKAGNYKKGHFRFKGYEITIENPKGSIRKGVDKNGEKWEIEMKNHYGYFTKTKGKDGDAIDVFLGPNLKSEYIFVVDQKNDDKFDESKVMIGFNSSDEAKQAYLNNYSEGWDGFMTITKVNEKLFKKWLYDGYKQRKPFSEYVEIKKKKLEENTHRKIFMTESQFKHLCKKLMFN